jgi:hypothetical protein
MTVYAKRKFTTNVLFAPKDIVASACFKHVKELILILVALVSITCLFYGSDTNQYKVSFSL